MDILKEAGNVLSVVAPMLGTAIAGPLGGTAANFICKALGLGNGASPAEMEQAIRNATPDQLLALKQAEADFVTSMRQLDIDAAKLGFDDKASARDREKVVRDWTPRVLGCVIIVSFIVMACFVLSGKAVADTVIAGTIIGYMSAKAEQVLGYYFGSSAGSADKSDKLANSVPANLVTSGAINFNGSDK